MKVILRILVIVLSFVILIVALLPGDREPLAVNPDESVSAPPARTPDSSDPQSVIRDLLGGAALDSGKKAKDMIHDINSQRIDAFNDLEASPSDGP